MDKRLFEAMEEVYGTPFDPFLVYRLNLEMIATNGINFIGALKYERDKHKWFLDRVRVMADQAAINGKRYVDSLCNEAERYVSITKLLRSAGVLDKEDYDDVIAMLRKISGAEDKLIEDISERFDEDDDINFKRFMDEVDAFLKYSRTVAESPPEGYMYHDIWAEQFDAIVNEAREGGERYLKVLRERKETLDSMMPKIAAWDERGRIDYEIKRDEWNRLFD